MGKRRVEPTVNGNDRTRQVVLMSAMAAAMISAAAVGDNFVDVKVYFDGNCPTAVDNWVPTLSKAPPERVRWIPYELDGKTVKNQADFDIHFDPFVGPSPVERKDGTVLSPPVSGNAPVGVLYKYTVTAPACTPLDPYIRIQ
jgi:hypothetical protein